MNIIIITIIIVYLMGMLAIGFWANKFNKGMTDYILAGRRLGLWLACFAIVASYFGGGYVMGLAEAAYQDGLVVWWFGIGGGIGLILTGFLAGKVRAMKIYTIPDYLERRYGGRLFRPLVAILTFITYTGVLASQIMATKGVLSMVGLGSTEGTLITAIVFITYSAVGGLWAATLTDFVQIIIATVGIIAAYVAVNMRLQDMGGFVSSIQVNLGEIDQSFFSLIGTGDWSYIIWLAVPMLLTTLAGADIYQRILASKDEKTAQRACWLGGVLIIVITLFPTLIGMSAHAFFPNLTDASAALPNVVNEVLSPIMTGLLMAAILSAIMSTATAVLTVGASNIAFDLIAKTIQREQELDEKKFLHISRLALIVTGVLGLIVAMYSEGIIAVINTVLILNTSGLVVPVVGGILWKRPNLKAGLAAFFTGIVGGALSLSGVRFGAIPPEVFGVLVSLIVFIIVTLATTPSKNTTVLQ
jgi:SSS family solute:Na+ symporter